jgi:signal transduction histidine kinase
MLNGVIAFCTSWTGLYWLVILSDISIAAAYFAIPMTMAVVFLHRKSDLPYPWLWVLFVAFITACGLTHSAHAWSAVTGTDDLFFLAIVEVFCALASVGTAVAFACVLPSIRLLPSPKQQRDQLERAVAQRTREKDRLLHEIHHRLGNQLQVLHSLVSIESRRAETGEAVEILSRVRNVLDGLGEDYKRRSEGDYLAEAWRPAEART